jgi:2-keto-3-deoxy-L-fuconate dehydrogenase
MNRRLEDKLCFVTAAAQGIGRATVRAFAREGARIIATDIDAGKLESLKSEEPSIQVTLLDVTDAAAVGRAIEVAGPIEVLFNCAGFVHQGSILACTEVDWRRSFQINVDSMYWTCRSALTGMVARRRGSIINMSSVASSVKGVPNRFAYSATKAAVVGLTKSIAADFVGQGVRCNAICPGTVKTPSLADRVAAIGGNPDEVWRGFVERQPMRRLGDPEEIAALAVYLASDESSFTTGQVHVIDGGWSN